MAYPADPGLEVPPNVYLSRTGQIKGSGATWGPGAAGLDDDRQLFLKLGTQEILDAFERNTVFKGRTRMRNIRGGKSAAFPITGKMEARYHKPMTPILGETNAPSDLNERVISLDALMIADAAVYDMDQLMSYFDVRRIYTTELGRALAYEYDRRVARMVYAAAKNTTEPLAKGVNAGRIGASETLSANYATGTAQVKGDELVQAIFNARTKLVKKDVPLDGMVCVLEPEAYHCVTQSSRAINTDFNAGVNNGSFAGGTTARVAGMPLIWSNHVQQPAYTLVAGDHNSDYAQNLSKCVGLIFHEEAVGVLTLMEPSLQVTSGDFNIQYQSTLLVARQALGMGILRAEAAVAIETP